MDAIFRVLSYVKNAIGETDVPDSLPEFIGQRRRWLNGSFFAAVYALAHTKQILVSDHSVGRKVCLMIESTYGLINLIFAWFAIVSNSMHYAYMSILTHPSGQFLFIFCWSLSPFFLRRSNDFIYTSRLFLLLHWKIRHLG